LNDLEAKQKYRQDIEIVLKKRGMSYKKKKNEIFVSANHFGKIGLTYIRIIIIDPSNKEEINRITKNAKNGYH